MFTQKCALEVTQPDRHHQVRERVPVPEPVLRRGGRGRARQGALQARHQRRVQLARIHRPTKVREEDFYFLSIFYTVPTNFGDLRGKTLR